MKMSESKKVLQLGQLPKKELHELTKTDNTVLATALIYSIIQMYLLDCLIINLLIKLEI